MTTPVDHTKRFHDLADRCIALVGGDRLARRAKVLAESDRALCIRIFSSLKGSDDLGKNSFISLNMGVRFASIRDAEAKGESVLFGLLDFADWCLALPPDDEVSKWLLSAYHRADPYVRIACAECLSNFTGNYAFADLLTPLLTVPDEEVAVRAVAALIRIRQGHLSDAKFDWKGLVVAGQRKTYHIGHQKVYHPLAG